MPRGRYYMQPNSAGTMQEITDFETFYTEKMLPYMNVLEPKGNDVSKWFVAGIACALLSFSCFMIHEAGASLVLLIGVVISVYKYTQKKDDFTVNYKETVITEIIQYLNPGAVYNPAHTMSPDDYEKSGLFNHIYKSFTGEDHIKGMYKNVPYYCSEIQTSYLTGGDLPSEVDIFYGLFFAAPLNNLPAGNTYIWPENDRQLPQSVADEYFHRYMPLPEGTFIGANNAAFNRQFTVYSTNVAAARYIVNDTMMERMLTFKNQVDRDVRFSFVDGVCYVAIAMEKDLFEPSFSDPQNKEEIKEYFFSFLLILSIINQLDLASFMV